MTAIGIDISYEKLAGVAGTTGYVALLTPAEVALDYTEEYIGVVRSVNLSGSAIAIRIAIGSGGSPASTDWLEYDTIVRPGFPVITPFCVNYGDVLWVRTAVASVTFVAIGQKRVIDLGTP